MTVSSFFPFRTARRRPLLAMAGVLVLTAAAPDAGAQTFDHRQCFKIRDERTFSGAAVDLEDLAAELGLQSCTIKGGAKKYCVPVSKTVTAIEDGSTLAVDGEELANASLCYKLRCPEPALAPKQVTDQFGTRTIGSFKAVELCTPVGAVSLDDTFDGTELDTSWSVHNPSLATVQVTGGALHLVPTMTGASNIWFDGGEGPLVYKLVTGDFDVSAVLSTRDPAIPANPPPPQYRLAGILARDPASTPASSNTVHVALGAGSAIQGTSYEYKSTDDSVSTWATTPTASPDGEVRLRRSGTTVEMYWRPDAISSWTMIQSFVRADLPATLQVGPMAYSLESPASIEAVFDEIDFQ